MEFSAWSWASNFRLHEAACLIAGVVPISKRNPATDELPSQARPPLIKLVGAYYEWFLQVKNPERPKNIALEGVPNEDGSPPPFPDLREVSGEIVSREAIHRFVSLMAEHGFKSCYDFGPIGKAGPPHEVGHKTQAATPVPVTSIEPTPAPQAGPVGQAGPDEDLTQDHERRLARLRELGGNAKHKHGDWKFTGISALVEREKSEGRKRSDEKTIRADLKEAAQDELDARRAGAFTGLGAR